MSNLSFPRWAGKLRFWQSGCSIRQLVFKTEPNHHQCNAMHQCIGHSVRFPAEMPLSGIRASQNRVLTMNDCQFPSAHWLSAITNLQPTAVCSLNSRSGAEYFVETFWGAEDGSRRCSSPIIRYNFSSMGGHDPEWCLLSHVRNSGSQPEGFTASG